jgi:hypothetical protein
VTIEKGGESLTAPQTTAKVERNLRLPLRLTLNAAAPGRAQLRVLTTLYYCREDNTGSCRVKTLVWRVPVEVTARADAPQEIKAQTTIKLDE